MAAFIPDNHHRDRETMEVPYFEDSKEENVPGRRTEKKLETLKGEVGDMLERLGGRNVRFLQGKFPGKPQRYGFQIIFEFEGVPGRLDCAALPLRSETENKKDRALAQSLYLLRNWLESEVYGRIYRPGAIPLLPYLTPDHDGVTVAEAIVKKQILPISSRHYLRLEAGS